MEAGTAELGPTYRLYPATESPTGWRTADSDVPADRLVLIPITLIGLYDDFDDDLGVPWAHPLLPLRRPPAPAATPDTGQPGERHRESGTVNRTHQTGRSKCLAAAVSQRGR